MSNRILVIRFGSLGDVILSSATVLNLKLQFPASELTYVTKERFSSIVNCFDGIDRTVSLPDKPTPGQYLRLLNELDKKGFDLIVDLHGNLRSWLARRLIKANRKVVYPKRRLERQMIVRRKKIPVTWPHTIDLYNDCLKQLGGRVVCKRPVIRPPVTDGLLAEPRDRIQDKIVIAPGAAHPNKQWEMEKFYKVARSLHESRKARIYWVITNLDTERTMTLSGIPPDDFVVLTDRPVVELASVLASADLTIANDSGLAHLSSAVGTPVIAVFGPTHPSLGFAPRGLLDKVIDVDEFCRPCSLHGGKPCYRDERYCFTRIPAERVTAAAETVLDRCRDQTPVMFVDRDGTIMIDKGYLSDPDQVELEPGSAEALKLAARMGYKLVIVSNQSGVARGYFTCESVERVNGRLLEILSSEGVKIDAVYYCPHHPDNGTDPVFAVECDCRKPSAGMAEQSAGPLGIDLRKSVVIGDTAADYNLGRVLGARSLLVRTGYGASVERRLSALGELQNGTVFDNLLAAVHYLVSEIHND